MDKFGLELAVKVHEGDINSKRDKIAVVIHWCLLKKGLSFSGSGDNFSNDDGNLTEILPANWNQSDFTWKYRELKNKPNKFILKLFQDGNILNARIVRLSDEVSKNFSVDLTKDLFSDLELGGGKYHLVKEDDFLQKVFDALLKDIFPEPKPAAIENPERARQPPIQSPGGPRQGGVPRSPFENPNSLRIGGRDLDPFGNPMAGTGAEGAFGRGRGHFRGHPGGYQRGSGGSVSPFWMPPANNHFDLMNIGQAANPMETILDYIIPAYEVPKTVDIVGDIGKILGLLAPANRA